MTTEDMLRDAEESMAHMGASLEETGGGFVAVRVPRHDGGEILVNPAGPKGGWDVGQYGPEGEELEMWLDVAGEELVETVARLR